MTLTYRTTLTLTVSDDEFSDYDMHVTYLYDTPTRKPFVIYVEVDGNQYSTGFLMDAVSRDERLQRELIENAERSS